MTIPSVTTYTGDLPDIGEGQAAFEAAMATLLPYLTATLPSSVNSSVAGINLLATALAGAAEEILAEALAPRTVVRLDADTFYESGNHVDDYPATRAVVLAQTASGVGYVSSATYNSGSNRTEVTVTGITVDTGLTQAVLGLDPKYAPKIPTSLTAAANSIPIAGGGGALDESWVPPADWKATTAFTRTGAGSGTVTDNATNQALFRPGRPLRALSGSTYTYHIVTAYSAGVVTVAGPALPATIDALAYGDMSRVIQETFSFNGYFSDAADSALIEHDLLTRYIWRHGKAYCVHFSVRPLVDDSGAAQPRVNVLCAGSAVGNAGLAVNDAAWVSTTTDISSANYDISWGDAFEVAVDDNGTSDNAQNLTVIAVFVLE